MRAESTEAIPNGVLGKFTPYKHGDGKALGKNQAAILRYLESNPGTHSSTGLYMALDITQVDTCCALRALVKRGMVERHGSRGLYTYTRRVA